MLSCRRGLWGIWSAFASAMETGGGRFSKGGGALLETAPSCEGPALRPKGGMSCSSCCGER